MKNLAAYLFLASLCAGCATPPDLQTVLEQPLPEPVTATADKQERPQLPVWLVTTTSNQATGCAPDRDRPDLAEKIATSKALAELSRKDQVLIESRLELKATRSDNNGFSSETTQSVVQQSKATIDGWRLLNRERLILNRQPYLCVRIERGPTNEKENNDEQTPQPEQDPPADRHGNLAADQRLQQQPALGQGL